VRSGRARRRARRTCSSSRRVPTRWPARLPGLGLPRRASSGVCARWSRPRPRRSPTGATPRLRRPPCRRLPRRRRFASRSSGGPRRSPSSPPRLPEPPQFLFQHAAQPGAQAVGGGARSCSPRSSARAPGSSLAAHRPPPVEPVAAAPAPVEHPRRQRRRPSPRVDRPRPAAVAASDSPPVPSARGSPQQDTPAAEDPAEGDYRAAVQAARQANADSKWQLEAEEYRRALAVRPASLEAKEGLGLGHRQEHGPRRQLPRGGASPHGGGRRRREPLARLAGAGHGPAARRPAGPGGRGLPALPRARCRRGRSPPTCGRWSGSWIGATWRSAAPGGRHPAGARPRAWRPRATRRRPPWWRTAAVRSPTSSPPRWTSTAAGVVWSRARQPQPRRAGAPVVDEALRRAGLHARGPGPHRGDRAGRAARRAAGGRAARESRLSAATGPSAGGGNHLEGHLLAARCCPRPRAAVPRAGRLRRAHQPLRRGGPSDVPAGGSTRDDAAGEAYDKVARSSGCRTRAAFPSTGWRRPATRGHPLPPRAQRARGLRLELQRAEDRGPEPRARPRSARGSGLADLCASFQEAVADSLSRKLVAAARELHHGDVVLCGGVAANSRLPGRSPWSARASGTSG
jgi:hypothetical protein